MFLRPEQRALALAEEGQDEQPALHEHALLLGQRIGEHIHLVHVAIGIVHFVHEFPECRHILGKRRDYFGYVLTSAHHDEFELPDVENHSFFFINQSVAPEIEAKLHQHDAWELYFVVKGKGTRIAGDTTQYFGEGHAALIPPMMHHCWQYYGDSADDSGKIRYLMVGFSHKFVEHCIHTFPELRNMLACIEYPQEAIKFGGETSRTIGNLLSRMNEMSELERLCEMFRILPMIFTTTDFSIAGKPMRIERDVRRMQQISAYVMTHYVHDITLDEIATEMGMNRSAFCSYFKRLKGVTFIRFLVQYRLNTACQLLKTTRRQVSEICFMVGFNDLPHFIRTFTATFGMSPARYRKYKNPDPPRRAQ